MITSLSQKLIDIPCSNNDYLQIARIHKKLLNEADFLSECSEKLIAMFYNYIHSFNTTILFIIRNDSQDIQGFAFATTARSKYLKLFISNNLFGLLSNPSSYWPTIKAIIRHFRYNIELKYEVELVQIAVDHQSSGHGFGKLLLSRVIVELQRRNIDALFLQVYEDNTVALALYKKYGFEVIESFEKAGKRKYIMKLKL